VTPYCKQKSDAAGDPGFHMLLDRLTARLGEHVRNGETTERGLARRLGVSQPHLHHVLKGARDLHPKTADRILRKLGLSLLDLLSAQERQVEPMSGPQDEAISSSQLTSRRL
jgi:plasmid maintenance system antidote protein VapI